MQSKTVNTLIGLAATLIWSSAVFAFHKVSVAFGPFMGGCLEFAIDGAVLFLITGSQGKLKEIFQHSKKTYLFAGGAWLINLSLFSFAVGFSSSSSELVIVGLINYLWPIITLLCSVIILKKSWNWGFPISIVVSVVGIILCKSYGFVDLKEAPPLFSINYLIILFAAISWGLYSVFIKKYSDPSKATPVPLFMFATSFVHLLLFIAFGKPINPVLGDYVFIGFWSIFCALAYISWDIGMRYGNMVTVSSSAMLIPLLSTIVTLLGTGVGFDFIILISALLVVSGSYLASKSVIE